MSRLLPKVLVLGIIGFLTVIDDASASHINSKTHFKSQLRSDSSKPYIAPADNEVFLAKKKKKKKKKKADIKPTALADKCKQITDLKNGQLLIKKTAGGHISSADPRYPGFSVICAKNCVNFPAKVYHCNGSDAFSMGYYGKWSGNGKSRGYCAAGGAKGCSVSSVNKKSKQLGCKSVGYLDIDGSKGKAKKCYRIKIDGSRSGDV